MRPAIARKQGAINALAICAGIGGIELGLQSLLGAAYRTVCYVEREAYPAACLVARMEAGQLCDAPIWDDVTTFDGKPWRSVLDIVTAGYPCQPFSVAGRRRGHNDPRHLWPHIARIIGECQPRYIFLENVPGHVSKGFSEVCADLQGMGYDISAGIFSAAEVGAPHIRQRLFALAYPDRNAVRQQPPTARRRGTHTPLAANSSLSNSLANTHTVLCDGRSELPSGCDCGRTLGVQTGWNQNNAWPPNGGEALAHAHRSRKSQPPRAGNVIGLGPFHGGEGTNMANTNGERRSERKSSTAIQLGRNSADCGGWWNVEPNVDRVVTGLPHRLDRLRALGNAVVPATAALAFATLVNAINHSEGAVRGQ